ncbi:MAG: S9 family peptidase [Gemmatimonadota bacterium]|nr:MAG: S9 family peptidase [Gemmatimonadota bacterium]
MTGFRHAALAPLMAAVATATACTSPHPPPPETRREAVVDTMHGVELVDPYRWLEDQESPETRAWIERQNAYAEAVVADTLLRAELADRLRALMDVDDVGSPRRGADYEYFSMRRAGDDQWVIYRRLAPDEASPVDPQGDYEVVIDPHEMSPGHTTSVSVQSISRDGRLMIYSVRDGGQDEVEIRVRNLEQGTDLPDGLPNALYSSISFKGDDSGFYYSRRSRETGARVYFHRLGTDIGEDEELFGAGYGPDKFVGMSRIDNGRFRLYDVWHGWSRMELHFQDVEDGGPVVTLADSTMNARFYAQFLEGELYMRTNLDAPKNRIVAVDLENPGLANWREVIPEGEDVLQGFTLIDGKLYVTYLQNVQTKIRIFELDGTAAGEFPVPEFHSADVWGGDGKLFLSLSSFTTPPVTYRIDLETGEREVWQKSDIPFDPQGIVVRQVWATSKDGTRVPMFVMHKDGIELDGDHPTWLAGYGGFLAAITPRFDVMAALWVERGGVYAVANLRGGSEFGEEWHRAGMLENKQNVFDDFIAAAEWLVNNGYTNPDRLAIRGYSNGGLLVASALTQRPDLFRAALCGFPDLDMVRFYTFTQTNNLPALHEYGDASIPEHFEFLRAYSPYQAVKDGTEYPAVMLTSGDLDTRVPPRQARKMTARLQAATSSGLPVILRYDPKGGHTANRGRAFSRVIEDRAMELAFLLTMVGAADDRQ